MKFNYQLKRLCGAYYGHPSSTTHGTVGSQFSGANVIYDSSGDTVISAVANRVQVINLKSHSVRTLPVEARSNIRCIALSPDDALLLIVDVENYAMIVNWHRGVVLTRLKFQKRVRQAAFSPNGYFLAVTFGKHIQVWTTPNFSERREMCPMSLHRTYTGQSSDVTCLTWSPDSSVLMAGSKDCTARIWTLNTTHGYEPVTLSGHKTPIVGAYFSLSSCYDKIDSCITVSEDGVLVTWKCHYKDGAFDSALATASSQSAAISHEEMEHAVEEAVDFFTGGAITGDAARAGKRRKSNEKEDWVRQAHHLVHGTWKIDGRHYFKQERARVTSTSYSSKNQLLAVGFSSGIFGLYELPSVANIHTLSVGSNQLVKTCSLNGSGDWLALGCPSSQQLLVWEWRSETCR